MIGPTRRSVVLGLLAGAATAARAGVRPVILVFVSDESARSAAIADSFKAATDWAIRFTYGLASEADAGTFIADSTRGMEVAGVFAVGDLALRVAAREYASLPVVYADADAESAGVVRSGVVGVASRVDPAAALARLARVVPSLQSLGAVAGPSKDERAYAALMEAAGAAAGIKTSVTPVASTSDARAQARSALASSQLVWLLPSPGLWSGASLAEIFQEAQILKKPVVSFQRSHLEGGRGAALVLLPDPAGIGAAAAATIGALLGASPAGLSPVVNPLLLGNLDALRLAGVAVTRARAEALDELVK